MRMRTDYERARLDAPSLIAHVTSPWVANLATLSMMGVAATSAMTKLSVGGGASVTDIFLGIATIAVALESRRTGRAAPALAGALRLGFVLVMVGGGLGTLVAAHRLSSAGNLLLLGLGAVPVLVLRSWRPDVATLRRYGWFWVSGAVISGVWALVSGGGDASGRPMGLSTHPNQLAMLSALGAGVALTFALSEDRGGRWIASGIWVVLVLTVVRAGSRAGLVALVVTSAVVLARSGRGRSPAARARRQFGGGCLAAAVLATTLLGLTNLVPLGSHNAIRRSLGDVTSAASDRERVPLLESGLARIAGHPLTGSGFDGALNAHDIYVQVWAAAGLLGLVGFLLVAATVLRSGFAPALTGPRRVLASAFVSGYVGYLVAGTVQNFLWDRYLWLHVGVILSVATARDDQHGAGVRSKADADGEASVPDLPASA